MTDNLYDIGDKPILTASFTDPETGDPVDPDVVVCTVRPPRVPAAEYLTPAVDKVEKGSYKAQVTIDREGTWWYAFDGAGTHAGAEERSFKVRSRNVPR